MNARHDPAVHALPDTRFAALPSGVRLPYTACGGGAPLLFVHGSLCDYRYWQAQASVLSRHFLCISVSLSHYWPGEDPGAAHAFSWQTHVAELAAFIAALRLGPVHLVGHSRGGCVAFRLAQAHPHLVRTLTLADPGGPLQVDGTAPAALPAATEAVRAQVAALIDGGAIAAGVERFVDSVSLPGTWQRSPASFRTMALANATTLPKQFRDPLPPYTQALARGVHCPTLLVAGERSPRMYRDNVAQLEAWMPRAQRRVVAGASHGMTVTHPAAFNRLLQAFLAAPDAPAAP
ncbi:alpha/beta fold hydrolase [uncultured Massilia sp.]|uniref:alpha/beta fold hydrolase n=1 Tax=uncultured Massilia sp. TaxID=169973 RepID=UPI0025FB089B|nr:alpha/beta hydrolase [uncultured Massilia sp.]